MNEPTSKQLRYLKDLGYELTPPKTTKEASYLIDHMKGGTKAKQAEKEFLKLRKQKADEALAIHNEYMDGLARMNKELKSAGVNKDLACVGFRLKANQSEISPEHQQYIGAFIPFELARKRPDIMLLPDIYAEELKREPKHGKFVKKNGSVIEVEKKSRSSSGRKQKSGCLSMALTIFLLISYFLAT